MKRNCNTANKNLLVVATDNWRERILHGLGRDQEDITWCAQVYEATAIVTECVKNGGSAFVIVMIDSITNDELGIFGTLARIGHVETAAVSAVNNKLKMTMAKQQGANKVLPLSDLPLLSTEPLPSDPHINLPGNALSDISEEGQTWPTAQDSTPERPVRRPPPKTDDEKDITQPTLSREELDALLGK